MARKMTAAPTGSTAVPTLIGNLLANSGENLPNMSADTTEALLRILADSGAVGAPAQRRLAQFGQLNDAALGMVLASGQTLVRAAVLKREDLPVALRRSLIAEETRASVLVAALTPPNLTPVEVVVPLTPAATEVPAVVIDQELLERSLQVLRGTPTVSLAGALLPFVTDPADLALCLALRIKDVATSGQANTHWVAGMVRLRANPALSTEHTDQIVEALVNPPGGVTNFNVRTERDGTSFASLSPLSAPSRAKLLPVLLAYDGTTASHSAYSVVLTAAKLLNRGDLLAADLSFIADQLSAVAANGRMQTTTTKDVESLQDIVARYQSHEQPLTATTAPHAALGHLLARAKVSSDPDELTAIAGTTNDWAQRGLLTALTLNPATPDEALAARVVTNMMPDLMMEMLAGRPSRGSLAWQHLVMTTLVAHTFGGSQLLAGELLDEIGDPVASLRPLLSAPSPGAPLDIQQSYGIEWMICRLPSMASAIPVPQLRQALVKVATGSSSWLRYGPAVLTEMVRVLGQDPHAWSAAAALIDTFDGDVGQWLRAAAHFAS